MDDKDRIANLIRRSRKITVLTGAGVSTDSGIPDFKSTDESWKFEEPREALLSAIYWRKNPEHFWEVYRSTLRSTASSNNLKPGPFHEWLVDLESQSQTALKSVLILTQNVDGLHLKAGSSNVLEAHGNSSNAVCITCKTKVPMESVDSESLPLCKVCDYSILKPDVSLFFEGVNGIGEFRTAIRRSDLLIVAGTSLNVGPVNELPLYAQINRRIPTLWLSNERPPDIYRFSYEIIGSIADFTRDFKLN